MSVATVPGAETFAGSYLSTRPVLPPEEMRAAALRVCASALDVEDARGLLVALGLLDYPTRPGEPLTCGHAHASLRRRLNGRRGTECVECRRATGRVDEARRRRGGVTAS